MAVLIAVMVHPDLMATGSGRLLDLSLQLLLAPVALLAAMGLAALTQRGGSFGAALRETVLHTIGFLAALLAAAMLAPADDGIVLTVTTALWVSGRLLFWVGQGSRTEALAPGRFLTAVASATLGSLLIVRLVQFVARGLEGIG